MTKNSERITNGMLWSFLERISSQGVSTIISIILARLILPEEFGVIAAVTIFTGIATAFVSGGFGAALIQRKDADELDYSSMFWFNLCFSMILLVAIYGTAPYLVTVLNETYDYELLVRVLRILGIGIVFASFNSFYRSVLMKNFQFKKLFFITFIGTIMSAIVGIAMAVMGYGVWALVAQNLISYASNTVLFILLSRWHPKFNFSFRRLKPMLSFGGKLTISSLLTTIYADINSLVIGNQHSSEELAFYRKGITYPKTIVVNILSAINTALFPAMVKMETVEEAKNCVRKYNKLSSFIISPMMFGFAAVAPAFVSLLLTDKWLPCVIYLQLSCLDYALQPIGLANLQYWRASGRGTLYLVTDVIKKVIGLLLLAIVVRLKLNPIYICVAQVISTFFALIINLLPGKKLLNYSLVRQLKDVLPQYILSAMMFVVVSLTGTVMLAPAYIELLLQMGVGVMVYVCGAKLLRIKEMSELFSMMKRYLKVGKNKKC